MVAGSCPHISLSSRGASIHLSDTTLPPSDKYFIFLILHLAPAVLAPFPAAFPVIWLGVCLFVCFYSVLEHTGFYAGKTYLNPVPLGLVESGSFWLHSARRTKVSALPSIITIYTQQAEST